MIRGKVEGRKQDVLCAWVPDCGCMAMVGKGGTRRGSFEGAGLQDTSDLPLGSRST